jgi:hypothetical protein
MLRPVGGIGNGSASRVWKGVQISWQHADKTQMLAMNCSQQGLLFNRRPLLVYAGCLSQHRLPIELNTFSKALLQSYFT